MRLLGFFIVWPGRAACSVSSVWFVSSLANSGPIANICMDIYICEINAIYLALSEACYRVVNVITPIRTIFIVSLHGRHLMKLDIPRFIHMVVTFTHLVCQPPSRYYYSTMISR